VVAGAVAAGGLLFLHQDAAALYHGLIHRGLPLVVLSAVAGAASLGLLYRRNFITARLTAALAVTAVLWAWAAAQYPKLLNPGLTISQAAAGRPVLLATLASLGAGTVLLVPSLAWLYILFQRSEPG
jgi:cytochrome d ubiquinol oxidase subunit II